MRYFFNVIEEGIWNEDYSGYRAGRIEVYKSGKEYAVNEIRFFIPKRYMKAFRALYDGLELTDGEIFRVDGIGTNNKP